jgi:hypothetical protein
MGELLLLPEIELVYRTSRLTRSEAESAILTYIDGPCCPIWRAPRAVTASKSKINFADLGLGSDCYP